VPVSIHVGSVVDKLALAQVFLSSLFSLSISFHHDSPYSTIRGMNNKQISGCSSETLSHAIDMMGKTQTVLKNEVLRRICGQKIKKVTGSCRSFTWQQSER
jgi:hypothetical protein